MLRKAGVFKILLRLKKKSKSWYLFALCAYSTLRKYHWTKNLTVLGFAW